MSTNKLWLPKLDQRLQTVASLIRSSAHVDIGSDHGHLLFCLLQTGQIQFGIAIESNQLPYENSAVTLRKFLTPADHDSHWGTSIACSVVGERGGDASQPVSAEVRLGDGLAVYKKGEAESLSICGLGGSVIARILGAFPDRVPNRVVLQPNNKPEYIRRWALQNGFGLLEELIVGTEREFVILSFERCSDLVKPNGNTADPPATMTPPPSQTEEDTLLDDPAYQGVELEAGILFGPMIIKRNEPSLAKRLQDEIDYWSQFPKLKPSAAQRLELIQRLKSSLPRNDSAEAEHQSDIQRESK